MGGTVKRSSSVLTPSPDCLCTNAIVVEYVGLTFLGRLSLASSLRCSDSCLRGCSFYTFTRSHARNLKVTSVTRRLAAFFMFCPDKTSPAIRTPVFNVPLPKATAPLLMSGMSLRSAVRNLAGIVLRRSRAAHHPPAARNSRCNSSSGPMPSKMKRHRQSTVLE